MPPQNILRKHELSEEEGNTVLLPTSDAGKKSPEVRLNSTENDCCIAMPPLLKQLFGVSVVPQRNAIVPVDDVIDIVENGVEEEIIAIEKVEDDDFVVLEKDDEDDTTLASTTTASRSGLTAESSVNERKKKRKSRLKRLKKKIGRRRNKSNNDKEEVSLAESSEHVARERAMTTETLRSWPPNESDELLTESNSNSLSCVAVIEARIAHTQSEIQELQNALNKSRALLEKDQALLVEARRRTSFRKSVSMPARCESFMRVHDLNLECTQDNEFFSLDDDLDSVLEALSKLGLKTITSEEGFKPTRDTEKILAKGLNVEKDVLVWSGEVTHKGFGSHLPVLKARGIVNATPRQVLDLIFDNDRVQEYNKMSLGRETVCVLLHDDDEKPRMARINSSLNKPPFVRKTIEMKSLIYAHAAEDDDSSYLLTSRSVWEQDGVVENPRKNVVRSEMLLGVNLLRPYGNNQCEMTTITHVYSPGVPEMLARSFAPTAAANFIKDMQQVLA